MARQEERVSLRVEGRVQGVGFRVFVAEDARRRGLRGFVRNLLDGSVEIVAEGPRPDLEACVERVRRGPDYGRVDACRVHWSAAIGDHEEFRIRG